MKPLSAIRQRLKHRAENLHPAPLYYADSINGWVLEQIAAVLREEISRQFGIEMRVTPSPWHLRDTLIHFGDRYLFLTPEGERLHPSNRLIVTWFHGALSNPEFAPLYQVLARRRVDQVLTSCATSRQSLIAGGVSAERIATIPIGVDLRPFTPVTTARRAASRTRLNIPLDAICVGSFQKDGVGWGDGEQPKWVKGPDVFVAMIERESINPDKRSLYASLCERLPRHEQLL
jgi:hypothetical protein